jgi:hypothetical protein
MSLRRIGKLFAAQNAGQLVTVLTQLLLPPAFLHSYGVNLYGQWLALSAAVAYLSTFNYGLQTFTNMQVTIHYNRGELQDAREVQSAGLRILLSAFVIIGITLAVIFLIPLDSLLRLTIPLREAQWTLYILGCQVISSMVFGFFTGSYSHRYAASRPELRQPQSVACNDAAGQPCAQARSVPADCRRPVVCHAPRFALSHRRLQPSRT